MTIPELNPIEAPDLICTQCGHSMRREIKKRTHNGKLDAIVYYCDSDGCRYAKSISMEHKNGLNAKYEPLVPRILRPDNAVPATWTMIPETTATITTTEHTEIFTPKAEEAVPEE